MFRCATLVACHSFHSPNEMRNLNIFYFMSLRKWNEPFLSQNSRHIQSRDLDPPFSHPSFFRKINQFTIYPISCPEEGFHLMSYWRRWCFEQEVCGVYIYSNTQHTCLPTHMSSFISWEEYYIIMVPFFYFVVRWRNSFNFNPSIHP